MNKISFYPDCVIKRFGDPEAFNRELRVYRLGLPCCPKMLDYGKENWLIIQFIDGSPYVDVRRSLDYTLLGRTIADFHNATGTKDQVLCHIDNNPKNILLRAGQFYLIDFEDSEMAAPETDLSHLVLFWLGILPHQDIAPAFNALISGYRSQAPLNKGVWPIALEQSRLRFIKRRQEYNKPVHNSLNKFETLYSTFALD